jgi:recombination protein RecA
MIRLAMERPDAALDGALATLRSRWGSAAIRLGSGGGMPAGDTRTQGALALAPGSALAPGPVLAPVGEAADVISTGFPALDAILGPAGLPREASAVIRGDLSSGKTTLALRTVAEAQSSGAIAAWLDLGRAFDPHEALIRGVDLRWLLVLRPGDIMEGFAMAGSLVSGRTVDLLVVDLPARPSERVDGQVRRLAAHARRSRARLLVLEPTTLVPALHAELAEATGLRLELERRAWLRLGKDVVGQRTEVTVARNRYGPPGRRTALEIHYRADGERGPETDRLAVHQLGSGEDRPLVRPHASPRAAARGP